MPTSPPGLFDPFQFHTHTATNSAAVWCVVQRLQSEHEASRTSQSQNNRARPFSRKFMAQPNNVAVVLAACIVVVLVLGGGGVAAQDGGGQCMPQLNRLLACRAYVVPGAPDPSPDCCAALSSVSHECACSTMGIINSLPSRCNVPQVNCAD